jgi:Ca-activated chloride channel family protein
MRKTILVLLASVMLLSIGSSVASADGMVLPFPEALDAGYLAVRYHHVSVAVEDGHAVTRVEQEFFNPHDVPIAGRYLFPVPPEAILSGFQATVDGQRQQVARQDAAATNAQLYAIVAQQHDPTLLQYADWESLAFDFNLEPGESRKMSLAYEEVLMPNGGLYRYRYVLSTERYSVLPVEEVSVTVDVNSSSGLASLYSSSHDVSTERQGPGRARVRWEVQNVNPTEDFELFFAPADAGFGGGLLTGERNAQDHFLFVFSPEADPHQSDTLPKDIVFVIDRSGSMSGEKIEQARDALDFILGQLGESDRFSIVSFDDRISVLEHELQPVNWRTLDAARRYVYRLSADGSTDLEAALQTGLEIIDRTENRGATRMVVFLTDGLPTAGITDEARIARLVTETNNRLEARLHVFGVGYDVNTHLLDRLAADNSGSVTYVQPGENLEVALTQFYAKIAHPLLTDVEVEFDGIQVADVYPESLPDLFQGSSLLLTGRYHADGDTASVRVRGWAGNEQREYVYRFDLSENTDRDFVPRLWATRRVGALLDQVRVEGESQALVDEIRDLGLSYGIVTPYTTFVVEAQADGVASVENMDLYNNQAELNQSWGRVTIKARVQNQMYQEASQANLAVGANVQNYGRKSLAQVGTQQVDLSLLRNQKDLNGPISTEWIEGNIEIDRTVEFGSDAYFDLAADPEARPFLQSGQNVVFEYQGQIISVRDPDYQAPEPVKQETKAPAQVLARTLPSDGQGPRSTGLALLAARGLLGVILPLAVIASMTMVLGLMALVVVVRYALKPR